MSETSKQDEQDVHVIFVSSPILTAVNSSSYWSHNWQGIVILCFSKVKVVNVTFAIGLHVWGGQTEGHGITPIFLIYVAPLRVREFRYKQLRTVTWKDFR